MKSFFSNKNHQVSPTSGFLSFGKNENKPTFFKIPDYYSQYSNFAHKGF
jgi:hypothetical protein